MIWNLYVYDGPVLLMYSLQECHKVVWNLQMKTVTIYYYAIP